MDKIIRDRIIHVTANYPHSEHTGWEDPLIAYARADDPLFDLLKEVANPTHCKPEDFLEDAKSVITYFIPFQKRVISSNKKYRYASRTWATSYLETNKLIADINKQVQTLLIAKGYKAVYVPATHNFNEKTLLSDWSHRSAAYIAGLGTFGLNHMLITDSGCCGRIGSLVTDLVLKPTQRPTREYCLYKVDGSCGKCAEKCVNGALNFKNLDKHKCYKMCLTNADQLSELESIADVCGKCLVDVPCSTKIPTKDTG